MANLSDASQEPSIQKTCSINLRSVTLPQLCQNLPVGSASLILSVRLTFLTPAVSRSRTWSWSTRCAGLPSMQSANLLNERESLWGANFGALRFTASFNCKFYSLLANVCRCSMSIRLAKVRLRTLRNQTVHGQVKVIENLHGKSRTWGVRHQPNRQPTDYEKRKLSSNSSKLAKPLKKQD